MIANDEQFIELTDNALYRLRKVLNGELDAKCVSSEEIEALHDMLYDYVAATRQTHFGSLTIQ